MKKKDGLERIGVSGILPAYKEGTKKRLFSLWMISFDPDVRFIGTDEAKEYWRKRRHISKEKIEKEYTSIFAAAIEVGRGKNKHWEFNRTIKTAADTIFIVPIKWRKEAYKYIQEFEAKLVKTKKK